MQSLFGVVSHDGIDFAIPENTRVLSAASGVIISAGTGLYGLTVVIEHPWGRSYYGHLSSLAANIGEQVSPNQLIGYSGSSGVTTGPHLHFGIRPNHFDPSNGFHGMVDPLPYLNHTQVLGVSTALPSAPPKHKLTSKFRLPRHTLKSTDSSLPLEFTTSQGSDLQITLTSPSKAKTDITGKVLGDMIGPVAPKLTLDLAELPVTSPGQYTITITDSRGDYDQQTFDWGVLAMNADQATYHPGDTAQLAFAVLDESGNMVCTADLELVITNPFGQTKTLSTQNGGIILNQSICTSHALTIQPDYQANYLLNGSGQYNLHLTAQTSNGTYAIDDYLSVTSDSPFYVRRESITRVYPLNRYPVSIQVTPTSNYQGLVTETVPSNFVINDISPAATSQTPSSISWRVDWLAGESYTLNYTFDAPDKSPDLYLLGPLQIGNSYTEGRAWQLAIDTATVVVLTSGTTWNVPSDWNSSDNTIEAIGAGGNGALAIGSSTAGGGGGGGEYRKSANITLTASSTIDIHLPAGGDGNSASGSWVKNGAGGGGTIVLEAKNGGNASGLTGGAGGTGGTGASANYNGGTGGTSTDSSNTAGAGSGGGGSAGPTGIGKNGGVGQGTTSRGGGGGGGSNGGSSSAGASPTSTTGGTGGNGTGGTGGGSAGTAGTVGGGGGGGNSASSTTNAPGGAGSAQSLWGAGIGPSGGGAGGGGGTGSSATGDRDGGAGGTYGGGGGGCGYSGALNTNECNGTGVGGNGLIVITYTPALPTISIGGTANGNSGATVKVAVNGTVQGQTSTIASSAWNITGVAQPSATDIITVWIDGVTDSNESSAVTKWSTGNITGMVLNTGVVTVGSNQDTSLSLTNLNLYDCSEDEDIMYQSASSHLKVEGDACAGSTTNSYASEQLNILSGDTLTVSGTETLTTYDLSIAGTLTSGGNSTYNIAHDWANTGTFTSSTSTVNLNGVIATTQTLSGSTSFNNLSATNSGGGGGSWYNASWLYRLKLTIDHTKISADLTDYPVYINLADLPSSFHSHVNQTDGRDIRITKVDGTTELPREVVSYTSASDTGELHVKYSGTLSSSVDTDIYLYYGNAAASDYAVTDTYGTQNVWDSNYKAVWHFAETSGQHLDSTSNNNDTTSVNVTTQGSATGKLGGADEFVEANANYIGLGTASPINLGQPLTIDAWTYYNSSGVSTSYPTIISNHSTASSNTGYQFLYERAIGKLDVFDSTDAYSSAVYTSNEWQHSATTCYSGNCYFYRNGVAAGSSAQTISAQSGVNTYIGSYTTSSERWNGVLDEIRVSNVTRSADWMSTQYNNQSSSSTFYVEATEETPGGNRTLRFTAGTTQTVTGTLTITGSSGSLVVLESSTTSAWTINPSAAAVTYSSVSYSTNIGASFCATYSTNGGNNTGWSISATSSCSSNTAPGTPTSLTQTSGSSITTGGWVSSTSITFSATATDPDNPDTLKLCIEKDLLGVSFSNTEDDCSISGVAYSGTGVTVTLTITGQTDASEYHWQARIKDTAGAYSSWVSYGGNAETARDYGTDTTAPTGGTIYDGTGAGVDITYSSSSLSALSANWASINSNVSGLVKYEYSIGTSVGGTQIKTWTDNGTTTSVTSSGLTLQTSILYFFNVRTTDGAGNVSTPISSNGQLVAPSISFTVAPASLTFNNLSFSNSYSDTQNTTLTTSTNAYGGYVIRAFMPDFLRSTDTLTTIADFSSGSYASPATWAGAETGFGYTSSDTTIGGVNKFGTASLHAPFSHTGPGDIVADHTNSVSGTPVSAEVFTLTYKVKTAASQAAKKYTGTIIYTATAQY